MKITFILPSIGVAGGVRVVFEYANRLIDRGHDVYIVYPIIPPIFISRSKIKLLGSKIIGSLKNLKKGDKVRWFNVKAKLIRVPTLNPNFVDIVGKWIPNSDAIIATSWETVYFVNALPEEKGEKFYFIQHYEIWDIWNNIECWKKVEDLEKDPIKQPITMSYITPKDPYLKKLKELVDATYSMPLKKITISSWLKELLEKRFKQKVYGLIMNGINFDIFHCDNNKNWNAKKRIILVPYRGIPWKGDLDGLKALKEIYRKYDDKIEVWFHGLRKPNNLPSWAKFFKISNDDELRQLYCKAHIFVGPSWVEGFYLPPMEAMSCKCAVVTTKVGAVPEYTIPNKTAIVIPPRNPKKLAEGICYLLDNWDETKKIAKKGYNHIKQFTWEVATTKFENIVYKEIR